MPSPLSHSLAARYKKGNAQTLYKPCHDALVHMLRYKHMPDRHSVIGHVRDQGQDRSTDNSDTLPVNGRNTLDGLHRMSED